MTTIAQIANIVGVAPATVSRALRNQPKVSAALRKRIVAAARQLGYQVRSGSRSRIVGVVLQAQERDTLNFYSSALLNHILDVEAAARQCHILLILPRDVSVLQEHMVEGIVSIDNTTHISQWLPKIKNIPLVCINDYSSSLENVSAVNSDDAHGVELALEHLQRNGHRNIGFFQLNSRTTLAHQVRREAYEKWMRKHYLSMNIVMAETTEHRSIHDSVSMLRQNRCSAMVACGEGNGLELYRALSLQGIRIPQDMSIVSWENPRISELLVPRATTVAQDIPQLVKCAFDQLEKCRSGESTSANITVGYRLIERESVCRHILP